MLHYIIDQSIFYEGFYWKKVWILAIVRMDVFIGLFLSNISLSSKTGLKKCSILLYSRAL